MNSGLGKNYGLSSRVSKASSSTLSIPESRPAEDEIIAVKIVDDTATPVILDEIKASNDDTPLLFSAETSQIIPSETITIDSDNVDTAPYEAELVSVPIQPNLELEAIASTDVVNAIEVEGKVSTPELTAEERLRLKISEDSLTRNERMKGLSLLQQQLSKSVARKQEVEQLLSREVDALRTVINGAIEGERTRLEQLESLYISFRDIYLSKTVLLDSESKILDQMKAVRDMITEQVVLVQLDAAVVKKSELISIEKSICSDIKACSEEVNAEIGDTKNKISYLETVLTSLPAPSDAGYAARSYSWEEIEQLEQKIIQTVEVTGIP